ncbi:MAG: hypothetical protein M3354_11870, partial [Chloroflexota bacterium]|nr:hypothetical protein [Chloroflexota bacterium]
MASKVAPMRSGPSHFAAQVSPRTRFARRGMRNCVLIFGLAFFALWTLFPFLWIVETSIKPDRDLYREVSLW